MYEKVLEETDDFGRLLVLCRVPSKSGSLSDRVESSKCKSRPSFFKGNSYSLFRESRKKRFPFEVNFPMHRQLLKDTCFAFLSFSGILLFSLFLSSFSFLVVFLFSSFPSRFVLELLFYPFVYLFFCLSSFLSSSFLFFISLSLSSFLPSNLLMSYSALFPPSFSSPSILLISYPSLSPSILHFSIYPSLPLLPFQTLRLCQSPLKRRAILSSASFSPQDEPAAPPSVAIKENY